MARKKHTAEQIIEILRQVEVAVSNGRTTPKPARGGERTRSCRSRTCCDSPSTVAWQDTKM